MKRILIVSRAFFPMNSPRSFRATELAKEFSRQGHDVMVLTVKREEHNDFSKKHQLTIKDLGKPRFKPINLRGKGLILLFWRAIARFSGLLFEYPDIELLFKVKKQLKKESGYDILISIAVPFPIHWGVASVWKKNNDLNPAKVWIADCGDPYMGVENDTFRKPFYFKYVEKWFSRKTDFITVPVETAIPAYYPEFHHKIRVIPQGFNFDEIRLPKEKHNNPYPCFAYAGGLIPGRRDPKEFLEFLVNYPKKYQFDIYTNEKELVKDFASRSNGRIVLKDYIPREKLLLELNKLDFVVNFENAGKKQNTLPI